ncbi:MAG: hypothetical protein R3E34_07590 [Rhodocyclaceae bacterium]
MGYWDPDHEVKDTDVLAVFRITPQEGSTHRGRRRGGRRVFPPPPGRWWGPTASPPATSTRAKAYRTTRCRAYGPGYFCQVAYDLDLFEEGSIANLTASIIGNVFSFAAARLPARRHALAGGRQEDLPRPPTGIVVERTLDKFAARCSAPP